MKNLYALIFMLLFAGSVSGQKIYFNLTSGYGFDLSPETFSGGNISNIDPQTKVSASVNHSFGRGYNFGAAVGYQFNKNIAFGLETNFLKGDEESVTFSTEDFLETRTFTAEMWRIIPQLRLSFPMKKMAIYSEFGLAVGINPAVFYEKELYIQDVHRGSYRTIYTNGNSYGLKTGLGVKYQISKRVSFSAEARIFSQAYSPKRRQLLKAISNGKDVLPIRLPENIHTVYVDEIVEADDDVREPGVPSTRLKFYFPFSSSGVNFGVEYAFSVCEKGDKKPILD